MTEMVAKRAAIKMRLAYAVLWVLLLLSGAALTLPIFLFDRFSYTHAWVSSHFAVMAETFQQFGRWAMHLTPIQNYGPLTAEPDWYVHWPPLFPLVLSWVAEPVGEVSPLLLHSVSVALVFAQALVLGLWLRQKVGSLAALVAVIAFFNMPVIVLFTHLGIHLHLALLLALGATLLFHECTMKGHWQTSQGAAGLFIFVAACLTTWECFLLLPGFWLYWLVLRRRDLFAAAMVWSAAAMGTLALMLALYTESLPNLLDVLLRRALFRAGFGDEPSNEYVFLHDLANATPDISGGLVHRLHLIATKLTLVGPVGLLSLLGIALLAISPQVRAKSQFQHWLVLLPLMSVALLWVLLMSQHFSIHFYQPLIFALPAAMAAGFLTQHIMEENWLTRSPVVFRNVAILAALMLLIVPRVGPERSKYGSFGRSDTLVQLGEFLRATVPSNAIILVPWQTMVPTYYSKHHLLRNVRLRDYEAHRQQFHDLCRDCPFYLVVPDSVVLPNALAERASPLPGDVRLVRVGPVSQIERE